MECFFDLVQILLSVNLVQLLPINGCWVLIAIFILKQKILSNFISACLSTYVESSYNLCNLFQNLTIQAF